jgi:NitT/TauT family transport system ATP-binding protein
LAGEPIIEAGQLRSPIRNRMERASRWLDSQTSRLSRGKIIALLGASGCGKSTLLRILSGLSQPSSGALFWHGKPLNGQAPNVAIVFQSFALFPWLTVLENVEAPLEARGVPRSSAANARCARWIRWASTVSRRRIPRSFPAG